MPRPPKNKPVPEPVVPVVAAPSIPAAVAPAALNFKAPPVIDVDQFIRVRDSVSHLFRFHRVFRSTRPPRVPKGHRIYPAKPQRVAIYLLEPTPISTQHLDQNKPYHACFHLGRVA